LPLVPRGLPLQDPEYLAIVEEFADDQAALDVAFSNAW